MYEGSMYLMSAFLKLDLSSLRIQMPTSCRIGLPLRSVSLLPAARMSCRRTTACHGSLSGGNSSDVDGRTASNGLATPWLQLPYISRTRDRMLFTWQCLGLLFRGVSRAQEAMRRPGRRPRRCT